jgi:5-methylcytosine-specific restriction endonuclease McrA
MWAVPLPACSADVAYQTCISRVRDKDLKKRLEGAREEIRRADISYRKAGAKRNFSELLPETCAVAGVSAEEMVRIYDGRMAPHRAAGRAIYDVIKMGSPGGLCPLCGQRVVATLDHYLPKSRYAALAVNPANLIPACSDCNKAKSNTVDDTLHPYYDNIENEPWLRAELKEIRPASVSFLVDPPASWTPALADRVARHFRAFGLNRLYAIHAAQSLSGMQLRLSTLVGHGGAAAVRTHLADEAATWRAVHLNSWQVALHDCLVASNWFCSGGFRL